MSSNGGGSSAATSSKEEALLRITLLIFAVSLPLVVLTSFWMMVSRAPQRKIQMLNQSEQEEFTAAELEKVLVNKKKANDLAYQDLAAQLQSMRSFQVQVRQQLETLRESANATKIANDAHEERGEWSEARMKSE